MPCGSKSQPRSDGDNHAFAFAAGHGGHLDQSQEHGAATLAVAVDGDRGRAGRDRAAGIPRDGQRVPAHHCRRGRRRHRHRASGGLAGGNQQHGEPRSGAPDRGRARHRAGQRRQAADLARTVSRGRRPQAFHEDKSQPAAARDRRAGRDLAQGRCHYFRPDVRPRQQRDRGRQGTAEGIRRFRPRQYRRVRRDALDRGRRVRRRRQRVRIRDLGGPACGAEPVQSQQRRADRARASHHAGGAERTQEPTATTIRG